MCKILDKVDSISHAQPINVGVEHASACLLWPQRLSSNLAPKTHKPKLKLSKQSIILTDAYQEIETFDVAPFFNGFGVQAYIVIFLEMIEKCRFARTDISLNKYGERWLSWWRHLWNGSFNHFRHDSVVGWWNFTLIYKLDYNEQLAQYRRLVRFTHKSTCWYTMKAVSLAAHGLRCCEIAPFLTYVCCFVLPLGCVPRIPEHVRTFRIPPNWSDVRMHSETSEFQTEFDYERNVIQWSVAIS